MNEETINRERQGLVLSEKIKSDLLPTAKWAKYYFYYQCVSIILSFIYILAVLFSPEFISKTFPQVPTGYLLWVKVFAIIGLLIGICIAVFLAIKTRRFADSMKEACLTNSASEAQRGFAAMQSFSHFIGCLFLIVICLIVSMVFFLIPILIIGSSFALIK